MQPKPNQPNQTNPSSRIIHIVVYVVFQTQRYQNCQNLPTLLIKTKQKTISKLNARPKLNSEPSKQRWLPEVNLMRK
jgi:hypothetical protein